MVQGMDHDLEPILFCPAQLFRLQTQVRFLGVVDPLEEFAESLGFGGHGVGHGFGAGGGQGGLLLVFAPLAVAPVMWAANCSMFCS